MKTPLIILITIFSSMYLALGKGIDMDQWQEDIEVLAADDMYGRGSGQIGGKLAADYIAERLKKIGVSTFPNMVGYRQHVPIQSCNVSDNTKLALSNSDGGKLAEYGQDYLLYNKCSLIDITEGKELQFLGFGIQDISADWDDYKDIDVKGKIVVILEGIPLGVKINPRYGAVDYKQRTALQNGALGVIFVPLISSFEEWEHLAMHLESESQRLAYSLIPGFSAIWNPFSLDLLGFSLKDYAYYHSSDYAKNRSLLSINDRSLLFQSGLVQKEFTSDNIIGFIPPKSGSQEFIVLSSHYDHLGIGKSVAGDSIYNGLYDNAMGVASLLALASNMKSNEKIIGERGVIFLFTTAEEKGLLGSRYFTDDPAVPISNIVANINIDGISAFGNAIDYFALGAEYSSLGGIAKNILEASDARIENVPDIFGPEDHYKFSDQYSFALRGIPSIMIVDGISHKGIDDSQIMARIQEYSEAKYHTPFDDLTLDIDLEGAKAHTLLLYNFAVALTDRSFSVKWNPDSPYQRQREEKLTFHHFSE